MMMGGYTNVPWRISTDDKGFQSIRTGERNEHPDSDLVADVFGDEGNAHLIAAAPDLLDAVVAAQDYFATLPDNDAALSLYRQMTTAIARAKGESA